MPVNDPLVTSADDMPVIVKGNKVLSSTLCVVTVKVTVSPSFNDVLFDVDWQGSQQIKNSRLGEFVLSIFILPPSIKELENRLKLRNQDSDEVISNRMAKSVEEISHWPEYDYVLVNDDIDETEEKLKTIINAERLRLSQQPNIVEFIRSLNNEFGTR